MQIQIPGYDIVSTLSRSTAATVYLVWDSKTERELALKIIALAEDSGLPENLIHERERLLALIHPHIVTVFDAGIIGSHYFLTMPYLPGSSLNHKRFEMDLLTRLRVVADIAHALDFAGEQGFVHAALTPDNIWVTDQDNDAILLGFGLTQSRPANIQVIAKTPIAESSSLAAAHFYSPEQLQGKPLDRRSDLYSLGVILFLLLTDELPFQPAAQDKSTASDRATVPLLPECLVAFQPIINRLLSYSPEARYQYARECIADLGALPESVIVDAIEGAEHLLVRENETPLELMSRVIPFTAYTLFSNRLAEQSAIDSDNTAIIPSKFYGPLTDLGDHAEALPVKKSRSFAYEPAKLAIFAVIFCAAAVLLYVIFRAIFLSAPAANSQVSETEQSSTVAATALPASTTSIPQVQFASEPSLQQQAEILREKLPADFSVATDLVIIYRAALRGEDSREHALAQAGLEDLQRLFSQRILMYLSEDNIEAALRDRNLVEQLFEREELLPELSGALVESNNVLAQ